MREHCPCASMQGAGARNPLVTMNIFIALVALAGRPGATQDSIAFSGSSSYATYPGWLVWAGNDVRLSFRTSEADGTLLFVESPLGYLHVALERGAVHARLGFGPVVVEIGECALEAGPFNDNAPHVLWLKAYDRCSFGFEIDSVPCGHLNCTFADALFDDPASLVYIAGVPPNSSRPAGVSFVGCISGVSFLNDSASSHPSRNNVSALFVSEGATIGCRSPCDEGPCALNASCEYSWGRGEEATCDCRDTSGAGPNCEDDPANVSRLVLNGADYHCYQLPADLPNLSKAERTLIQLVPPLPADGTIMVGTAGGGATFVLYLENYRLHYTLSYLDNNVKIQCSSEFLPTLGYRVQVTLDGHTVTMVTSSAATMQEVDRVSASLVTLPSALSFDSICIGGGELETPIYRGVVQGAYHQRHAMSEERSFVGLNHTLVHRSAEVRVLPLVSDPPLTFLHMFASLRVAFDFRTAGPGPLIIAENGFYVFTVIIASSRMVFFTTTDKLLGNYSVQQASLELANGQWHGFELKRVTDGSNTSMWVATFDGTACNGCLPEGSTPALDSLSGTPIHIGWKTRRSVLGGFAQAFSGCIRNVEFLNGASPNLEVLARSWPKRFRDGCSEQSATPFASRSSPISPVAPSNHRPFFPFETIGLSPIMMTPGLPTTSQEAMVVPTQTGTQRAGAYISFWIPVTIAVAAAVGVAIELVIIVRLVRSRRDKKSGDVLVVVKPAAVEKHH